MHRVARPLGRGYMRGTPGCRVQLRAVVAPDPQTRFPEIWSVYDDWRRLGATPVRRS
jgi:hypothetical protein